jgi:hypothetical protein
MTGRELVEMLVAEGAPKEKALKFYYWLSSHMDAFKLFEQETLRVIDDGYTRFSAREIWERLRRDPSVSNTAQSEFKLDNDFTPYIARVFHAKHPTKKIFKTKRLS